MKKLTNIVIECTPYCLRLVQKSDIPAYFERGFHPMDPEIARLTGTVHPAALETIENYVKRIIPDPSRYDFLILNSEETILGEAVLNEINWETGICNFRICMFEQDFCGKGIGSQVISAVMKFGFEILGLKRIELEVFDFNERAYRAYRRAGFVETGRLAGAHHDGDGAHDIIVMAKEM